MESTGAAKMGHETGSASNYESQQDKAIRRYGKLKKDDTVDPPVKINSPKGR
jgi:hypothetical protein